jgi:NAD(P)-dependent dehydrogenase (short-subunit alcohol dehydrogenase family)
VVLGGRNRNATGSPDPETAMPTPIAAPIVNGLRPGLRVVVTAGAGGIGRAIVDMLTIHGARIHICDVADAALDDFRRAHPQHGVSKADVASEADMARMFDDVGRSLGGLDALINNAGIAGPTGAVEDISPAEWRRCIDVDLTGQFLCAHHAVPLIKAAGGGAIVNMSSAAGRHGYAYRTPYSAAKFGIIGLTQSLAKELGPHNIRVNAILPGIVEGPRMEKVIRDRAVQLGIDYDEMERRYLERVSLRRMVTPHDVAAMVVFLLSPMGDNLSGQSLGVDGNVETL